MNPLVDEDLCIGCGLCADIAPTVFELGDDAISHVIAPPAPGDDAVLAAVNEAVVSCPTSAIAA